MRRALALGLLVIACQKPKDPQGDVPASTNAPLASSGGGRLYRAPPASSALDLQASEGGWSLHPTAAKACPDAGADKKCLGEKCGPLCSRWIDEKFKSFATTGQKNRLYFACFGSCLAGGPPDAGR
jgi:hypothetical protein